MKIRWFAVIGVGGVCGLLLFVALRSATPDIAGANRAAADIRMAIQADPRFAKVTVGVMTNANVTISASDSLPSAVKADLERVAREHASGYHVGFMYLQPIPDQ